MNHTDHRCEQSRITRIPGIYPERDKMSSDHRLETPALDTQSLSRGHNIIVIRAYSSHNRNTPNLLCRHSIVLLAILFLFRTRHLMSYMWAQQ